ncbi:hypothetical protein [Bacillus stratosphericus]|uniref:hypothetical protein n=1 Tax=Bacillus stratosphericus TaxID=293386 RepID=UPI001CF9B240|nr:hypothetical protein [Bacillus stratosphericus]
MKSENASLKALFPAFQKLYPDQFQDTRNKNNMFKEQQTQSHEQEVQKSIKKVTTIKEGISL